MISGVLTVVLVVSALMLGGFTGAWAIWPTAYRHGYAEGEGDRYRHRAGARQETTLLELPRAGRLEPLPDLEPITTLVRQLNPSVWVFEGGWDQGPVAEPAEHDLLTQTAEQPVTGVDTPSDFTRKLAREVDELCAKHAAETNEFIFSMKDVG